MLKFFLLLSFFGYSILSAETKVLALAGSLREDSVNKKLVREAARLAQEKGASVTVISLKDYVAPIYDSDMESAQGMPLNIKKLRQLFKDNHLIFIASPEHNGSLSALLKNFIDWNSRNEEGSSSREAFQGKKFVIMSASPGGGGGARGLDHLRTILQNIGGEVIKGQIAIPNAFTAFDDQGHLKDPAQQQQLQNLVDMAL